jgi:hypothetical protein
MISFWKITFINSPEVQRQVVWSKGMVGYDSRKIAQNRTGVKRDFRHPFSIIFQTQDRKGNHNLLGVAQANQKLLMHANACNPKINPILAEIKIISTLFKSLTFKVK